MKSVFIVTVIALLTGCSSMGVEPWERDLISKDSMQLPPDYFDSFYDEHIYLICIHGIAMCQLLWDNWLSDSARVNCYSMII